MLTYDLNKAEGALYMYIYKCIKEDIISGKIAPDTKMPSKRTLANNLGVSTITVENAYDQLISEGYMYAVSKKGYFVAKIIDIKKISIKKSVSNEIKIPHYESVNYDLSSNITSIENFPFSTWAKIMREVLSTKGEKLLASSECGGAVELRNAIANHLLSFRGMTVDPNQIIIGAGTEYLYGLLINLLGKEKKYCIENPGYKKLLQIYGINEIECAPVEMDDFGIDVQEIKKTNSEVAHICPNHHFPTGITMPVSRRYELLAWANEEKGRYIIEDDYDSEFRLNGNPIPPLFSIDASEKVIYMNTFSKSLASTIRISYMVLPEHLAKEYYEKLSFYSCTVSSFEQYALADFISKGYFERHINRMRLHYSKKRKKIMELIRNSFEKDECTIIENDSGLHFLFEFNTKKSDKWIYEKLLENGVKLMPVTEFDMKNKICDKHQFILNYSNVEIESVKKSIDIIKKEII